MHAPAYLQSHRWFERAARVIPGGIYGHTTPANMVPGRMPYFAERGEGSRYWDVDGHEFIDYMCGYGPVLLGYNHPEIEEAAAKQQREGNCFNHPTRHFVELAERIVELVDFADWAVFGKNGSDMTTWALQVAREHTGRKRALMVSAAYHGTHAWCTPGHGGLIPEDREFMHHFAWNDLESFHAALAAHPDEFAAVITTPFHHPLYRDSVLPADGFFKEIEATCREKGILLILDDIRAGFRLHLGGSHRYFGYTPDIACYCKALGNGHPISAAVGNGNLRKAAAAVFLTGSYWNSAVPMAAALKTLEVMERDGGIETMRIFGEKLARGLEEKAAKHGLQVTVSGPPAIPFMTFTGETNLYKSQIFAAESATRGVFFHPHHNWFVCTAHDDRDLEQTLEAADGAFAVVREVDPTSR